MQASVAVAQADRSAAAPQAESSAEDRALAADLYALVAHLHKHCNADLLETVGALELSLSQLKLLHHLEDAPRDLTLKQGAAAVRLSLPAASRLVEDLVYRGLLERHEDSEDRRMKRIRLTPEGRLVIGQLNAARLSGLEGFVRTLGATDRRALSGALRRLLAREEIAASRPPVEDAE